MIYSLSLLKTTNERTNVTRYFKKVCGEWVRISKESYQKISDSSFRKDTFRTEIKNGIVRQYNTVYARLNELEW